MLYVFIKYMYGFTIRNCLMWLWKLRTPRSAVGKLKTQENQWYIVVVQVQRPENQESRWYKFQSESKSKGRRLMSQLKDSWAKRERILSYSAFLLFRPQRILMMPTHIRGNLLYSNVNLIQIYLHRHTQK